MITRYFIVDVADLTNDMLGKSANSENPFHLRKSLDGTQVVIKCNCTAVSVDLFKLGATPMTHTETIEYVNDSVNGFISDESE